MSGKEKKEGQSKIEKWTIVVTIAVPVLALLAGLYTVKKAIDLSTDLLVKVAETKKDIEGTKKELDGLVATYEGIKKTNAEITKQKDEVESKFRDIRTWLNDIAPRVKTTDVQKLREILNAIDAAKDSGKVAALAGKLGDVVKIEEDAGGAAVTLFANRFTIASNSMPQGFCSFFIRGDGTVRLVAGDPNKPDQPASKNALDYYKNLEVVGDLNVTGKIKSK